MMFLYSIIKKVICYSFLEMFFDIILVLINSTISQLAIFVHVLRHQGILRVEEGGQMSTF